MKAAWFGNSVGVLAANVCAPKPSGDGDGVAVDFPWQAEVNSRTANTIATIQLFRPGCDETIVRLYTGYICG